MRPQRVVQLFNSFHVLQEELKELLLTGPPRPCPRASRAPPPAAPPSAWRSRAWRARAAAWGPAPSTGMKTRPSWLDGRTHGLTHGAPLRAAAGHMGRVRSGLWQKTLAKARGQPLLRPLHRTGRCTPHTRAPHTHERILSQREKEQHNPSADGKHANPHHPGALFRAVLRVLAPPARRSGHDRTRLQPQQRIRAARLPQAAEVANLDRPRLERGAARRHRTQANVLPYGQVKRARRVPYLVLPRTPGARARSGRGRYPNPCLAVHLPLAARPRTAWRSRRSAWSASR